MSKHIHNFEKTRAGLGHVYLCECGARLSHDEVVAYLRDQIRKRDALVDTWAEMVRSGKIVFRTDNARKGNPVPVDFEDVE